MLIVLAVVSTVFPGGCGYGPGPSPHGPEAAIASPPAATLHRQELVERVWRTHLEGGLRHIEGRLVDGDDVLIDSRQSSRDSLRMICM
jgi:hypothetical protein